MGFTCWQGTHRPAHEALASPRLRLAANAGASAKARRAIEALGPGLDSDLIARAQLVVTEVVTNAFLHGGGGEIAVDFWAGDGALDVAVSDGGRGFTPRVLAPDDERGGFGLGIVDTLSETWGTSGHHGPGCVWFQVEWDAAKD